jgi:hypothetical protein
MKILGLLLLVTLIWFDVSAQSPESQSEQPPDLAVVKKNWRKEIHNPAMTADPFRSNDEQAQLQRAQKDNAIRNSVRVREGNVPQPTARPTMPVETESDAPSVKFAYRATVKNTGTKTIKAIHWEYLFFDSEKTEQIGQHTFRQQVNIRPNKSMELVGRSSYPPTRVLNAAKTQQLAEEISIRLIEYEDGSVWQRPLK